MEKSDTILIEVLDIYTWEPLQRNSRAQRIFRELDKQKVDGLLEGFAYWLLNYYRAMILNAIHTQHFPGKPYKPLSPAYVKIKKKKGWRLGFWEMTGFLMSHITIWKTKHRSYCIGFKDGVVHPVSGTPIKLIAKTLELGSPKRNIPARPLFMPYATSISKNIYDIHFKRYMREKHPKEYKEYLA